VGSDLSSISKERNFSKTKSKMEDHIVPPSGEWSGFYLQNGEKNYFTMHLSFSSSSSGVHGQCTDDEGNPYRGGVSDISGSLETLGNQQVLIHFEKHYRRRHSVDYEGYFTSGFKRIIGTYFNGSDTFEMDFKEQTLAQSTQSYEKKCAQLFSNFKTFFTQQVSLAEDLADFTIVCAGGHQIKSHKLILASQSKFFEGFFRRESKEMVMLDFKEEYVRICIAYMVSGEVNLDVEAEELEGVLEVANYLGMDCLVEDCARVICDNIDLENCTEVASLGVAINSKLIRDTVHKFIVDNVNELVQRKDLYKLPRSTFIAVLESSKLVLHTSKGNVVPGAHREFMVLALAYRWLANQAQPLGDFKKLTLMAFVQCTRFRSFLAADLEQLKLPNLFRGYLKSKFQDWEEVEEREDVIRAFTDQGQNIQWPQLSGPRSQSQETFYLYDPRAQSLARQGHQQFDQAAHGFDLSCDNFDQNITALRLFTLEMPDMEVLKKITLTFCDGSEKTVTTQIGSHSKVRHLELPSPALVVSGPWVADPLEHLLSLTFLLTTGSVVGFREDRWSLERSQSVLNYLPEPVHSANLRWIGLCGSVLDSSQCGDSIICNLKLKFSSLNDVIQTENRRKSM